MVSVIDGMNFNAATQAFEVLGVAIANIERRLQITLNNVNAEANLYFTEQRLADRAAISQLKDLRAAIGQRAFDARPSAKGA